MTTLFIYYLKTTVALMLFYVLYRLLYDRDTFFEWKRGLLTGSLVLSASYPIIDISDFLHQSKPVNAIATYYANALPEVPQQSWWTVQDLSTGIWLIYLSGVLFLAARMFVQLGSIFYQGIKGQRKLVNNIQIITLSGNSAPFSFFKWIFLNPGQHNAHDVAEVLAHERTHVREWHSLDVLLSELACIAFWFNPFVWLTKIAIRQNLEFLADRRVLSSGYDSKGYQYHLLRLTHRTAITQIGNNFNISQIKKRIIMMNKEKSSSFGLAKYALIVPLATILLLTNHAEAFSEKKDTANVKRTIQFTTPVIKSDSVVVKKKVKQTIRFIPPVIKPDTAGVNKNVKRTTIKFIPPTIKPDTAGINKRVRTTIKFVPPIIKPDTTGVNKNMMRTAIKFVPPVIKKDTPGVKVKKTVKFTPPVIVPDNPK